MSSSIGPQHPQYHSNGSGIISTSSWDDVTEQNHHHHHHQKETQPIQIQNNTNTNNDDDDDDPLIVVLDLDQCLIHSHFLYTSMEAAIFTHQWQHYQRQWKIPPPLESLPPTLEESHHHHYRAASLDSFRIVIPDENPFPSHFSHRNSYYQSQSSSSSSSSPSQQYPYLAAAAAGNHPTSPTYAHVFLRPGCLEFLAQVTQLYPTYIYTAGQSNYADPILNHLSHLVRHLQQQQQPQPQDANATTATTTSTSTTTTNHKNCIFQGRFYREHCTYDPQTDQYYKDLTQLYRHNTNHPYGGTMISPHTHRMVLIDNNPVSFLKHPQNGILVHSFFGPFVPSSTDDRTDPITSTTNIPTTPFPTTTIPSYIMNSDNHNNNSTVNDSTFTKVLQYLQELSILSDVRPRIATEWKQYIMAQRRQQQLEPPPPPPQYNHHHPTTVMNHSK